MNRPWNIEGKELGRHSVRTHVHPFTCRTGRRYKLSVSGAFHPGGRRRAAACRRSPCAPDCPPTESDARDEPGVRDSTAARRHGSRWCEFSRRRSPTAAGIHTRPHRHKRASSAPVAISRRSLRTLAQPASLTAPRPQGTVRDEPHPDPCRRIRRESWRPAGRRRFTCSAHLSRGPRTQSQVPETPSATALPDDVTPQSECR